MFRRLALLTLIFVVVAQAAALAKQSSKPIPPLDLLFKATALDDRSADAALAEISARWKNGYAAMVVDMADLIRRTSLVDLRSWIRFSRLIQFLEDRTGKSFWADLNRWREWVWNLPYDPHPEYGAFKSRLYAQIDPRFGEFFRPPFRSSIRLDEVEWGGVAVNGIPPLDYPRHVGAADATYLEDDNIIFGLHVNGVARVSKARPRLARTGPRSDWKPRIDGRVLHSLWDRHSVRQPRRRDGRRFGTSGLLYRSNKLMFDEETHSLWSSLDGTPVIGPLVGSGLHLSMLPVVATTWAEWKQAHPHTTVLSINTGFERDYSEGAAYRQYFATDALMFGVSKTDPRLKNKAEVLALRLSPPAGGAAQPVAIAAEFLRKERVYHLDFAGQHLVIVTSTGGANRVYQAGSYRFRRGRGDGRLLDAEERVWVAEEHQLRATFDSILGLPRVPAHRAFWFGWYAQHPDTLLIK